LQVTTRWLRVEPCSDTDDRGSDRNGILNEVVNSIRERIADKSADKGNLSEFDRINPAV